MGVSKTSLSIGRVIRALLTEDATVSAMVTKVYAVETVTAKLPYVTYRRSSLEVQPQKAGQPGADSVAIEVTCYAEDYEASVDLAEAVRTALDYVKAEHEGASMRGCYLSDSEEFMDGDAYAQRLVFTVKV